MSINTMQLSPPWYTIQRLVKAMFEGDKEVEVKDLISSNNATYKLVIIVSNNEKAQAIKAIMPAKIPMGNITVECFVCGAEQQDVPAMDKPEADIFRIAFTGNSIFDRIETKDFSMGGNPNIKPYCIFKKVVIQFWNDDLSDFYGNYNGLPTEIADQLFVRKEIMFSISDK